MRGRRLFQILFTESRAIIGGPIQKPYLLASTPLPHRFLYIYFGVFGQKKKIMIYSH